MSMNRCFTSVALSSTSKRRGAPARRLVSKFKVTGIVCLTTSPLTVACISIEPEYTPASS